MKSIDETKAFSEVSAEDYDMVVFVGGGGAYDQYYKNSDYLELAKKAKSLGLIDEVMTLNEVISQLVN